MAEHHKTRLGIVGLGRWGKVLVDAVKHSGSVAFTAAAGRDPARIEADAAAREMRAVPNLAALLADPAVDGIVLATPHSQHAGQVEACISAGKPVLVEKPFTLTLASASRVLSLATQHGILVAAAHNRRFLAPVVALKRQLAEGRLGTVLHIETHFSANSVGRYAPDSWRVADGESPAGGLAGSGIHQIDAIIHLDSAITEVFARTSRRIHDVAMDDTTSVMFRLASGATASLLTITATAPTYRIQVFGTRGKAELNGEAATRGSETLVITGVDGQVETMGFPPLDIERAELEAFAAAVRGEAPYPITADEVLNGVAAFEAVSRSADTLLPVTI